MYGDFHKIFASKVHCHAIQCFMSIFLLTKMAARRLGVSVSCPCKVVPLSHEVEL